MAVLGDRKKYAKKIKNFAKDFTAKLSEIDAKTKENKLNGGVYESAQMSGNLFNALLENDHEAVSSGDGDSDNSEDRLAEMLARL